MVAQFASQQGAWAYLINRRTRGLQACLPDLPDFNYFALGIEFNNRIVSRLEDRKPLDHGLSSFSRASLPGSSGTEGSGK